MSEAIFAGLDPDQRRAVEAVRGPVCILAGAGSGKTTTITRRIAHGLADGVWQPRDVLALTFTDRAANEMRERLTALGVGAVRARTFHAEALKQVAFFRQAPELVSSKAPIVSPLVRRLPAPYKFRATKDVAGEIEWARNRRLSPDDYADAAAGRAAPLPPDLMTRVYRAYEDAKRRAGRADFEDLLEMAIDLMTSDTEAAERIRARYTAFTVDEYQDVNLLQHTLLESWLGGRDEVCVVGDDHQAIYGFTGATPHYLLDFPRRHAGATVITLQTSYRSTSEVLALANRLEPHLGGTSKTLRAVRGSGPEPKLVEHTTDAEETAGIVAAVRRLHDRGVALEEMAVLYRINARSEDYEEAFAAAGIPYQVRDGAFLRRPGPRDVLRRLGRADPQAPAAQAVEAAALDVGWDPQTEAEGAEEITRQADVGRLVRLAEAADTVAAFVADLQARFAGDAKARGVVLSTLHRAKGLEWEAVFLPRLEERELPFALAKADEDVAEERRLLYVGITRAKTHLRLSWARVRGGRSVRRSRFVDEIRPGPAPGERVTGSRIRPDEGAEVADPALFERLRAWRKQTAEEAGVPAYVVFHDATLKAICELRPASLAELGRVSGIGPTKLERYGSGVLEVVKAPEGAAP